MLGYSLEELKNLTVADIHPKEDLGYVSAVIEKQAKDHVASAADLPVKRKDGSIFHASVLGTRVSLMGKEYMVGVFRDITESKLGESYREMGREILKVLNGPGDRPTSIQNVLAVLKAGTGFDAIGIRLKEGDDFPYFVQNGFTKDFLLKENTLIERDAAGQQCREKDGKARLVCTCGMVISGKTAPAGSLCTSGGSFWTNDSFSLLDIPPIKDPRLQPRNQCIHLGYASVALVPIRDSNNIVGLIQFNDRRKGCFTLETVELLEGIGSNIGVALMRKQSEEALREKVELLSKMNKQMIDRELRIIEVKKEVNKLCKELGRPAQYSAQ